MAARSVWLMYHELHRGAMPPPELPDTLRGYCVADECFRTQLTAIRAAPVSVVTAGEWVGSVGGDGDTIVITFDDGWAASLNDGVDLLLGLGMRATYYITSDYIGRPNCTTVAAIRAAAAAGMEIGAHGRTHRYLATCSENELRVELLDSKKCLEDIIGQPVLSAAATGGSWSPLVAQVARDCGYTSFAVSQPGVNRQPADTFRVRRVGIKGCMPLATVERYCRMDVHREAWRYAALELPKRILGMEPYARLRRTLFRLLKTRRRIDESETP